MKEKSFTTGEEISTSAWWRKMRIKYNIGLIISGIIAFIIYAFIVEKLVKPNHPEAEMNLIFIIIQAFFYLICMLLANIFYFLGPLTEKLIKPKNINVFRTITFGLGFWFSFALPFSIPFALLISN
jgi:hypothetical protein